MKKVLIITDSDPTRAYSCIKYLYKTLIKNQINPVLWTGSPVKSIGSLKQWGNNVHSYRNNLLGSIPKFGWVYAFIKGFFLCLMYRNQVIICHDFVHYQACRIIKKIFPKTKIIHYVTEIYTKKNKRIQRLLQFFYEKNPNVADLIIECDYERAKYRRNELSIKVEQEIILNTICKDEISGIVSKKKVRQGIPVIVYSGGAHNIGELNIIVDALSKVQEDFLMKFLCYGTEETLYQLDEYCKQKLGEKYILIKNRSREETLNEVYNSDIGVVYYDPTYSINTKYAAPTKFFEYIALCVPIVSSNNYSLSKLIDKYQIGCYMKTNDSIGLKECFEQYLQNNGERLRLQIEKKEEIVFSNNLCYEVQAKEAIDKIMNIICS